MCHYRWSPHFSQPALVHGFLSIKNRQTSSAFSNKTLKTYLLAGGKEKKKKLTITEHLLCSRHCPKLFVCSRYFNPHNHLQGPEVVQGEASAQSSRAFHFLSRTWRLLKVECLQKASAYLLSSHTYWVVVFNGTEHSVRTQEHPCPAHASTAVHDDGSRQVAPAHVANILYETVCRGRRAVVWPVDELQLLYNVTSSCLVRQREREESGWEWGWRKREGGGEREERFISFLYSRSCFNS